MKAPVSWLRDHVDLPAEVTAEQLASRLTALGLKLEALEVAGGGIQGPLVVGRVLSAYLYQTAPRDPLIIAAVALAFLAAATAACVAPARRATTVDPLIALRTE